MSMLRAHSDMAYMPPKIAISGNRYAKYLEIDLSKTNYKMTKHIDRYI
jgi:hypothetical protein